MASPDEQTTPPSGWRALGPGVLVAATGVGAGDLIAAAAAGQRYGLAVLWVVLAGAGCKWLLNEGIARWHLATGSSMIAGWRSRFPRWVRWYFQFYLLVWGLLVAGALGSACGVAWVALWPLAPGGTAVWATVHALVGYALVRWGSFAVFEKVMRLLIAAMFLVVVLFAVSSLSDIGGFIRGILIPTLPAGSAWLVLGLLGGVGGSVTLLCHGYWMRERGWQGRNFLPTARMDLLAAYAMTGVFGLAMIVIASRAEPIDASGSALVLALADQLQQGWGVWGDKLFLLGFWCAVFSSLLGVWQGVPYLAVDAWPAREQADVAPVQSRAYRWFLLWLGFPPLIWQFWDRPLAVVILYAVAGAFFMPFLAGTLLVMNNRRDWVGDYRSGWSVNVGLWVCLLVFAAIFLGQIARQVGWM